MASMTSPTDPDAAPDVVPPADAASPPPASPPPPSNAEWRPPRGRESNTPPTVVGLVFLAIGIWYFLDTTLGLTMPDLEWGNLWPVLLILIGGGMIYRAATAPRRCPPRPARRAGPGGGDPAAPLADPLDLADWRRRVADVYAEVRRLSATDVAAALA